MADHLSTRQRRFVDAYLGEAKGNATEAARIAGYSDFRQSGYQVLTNIYVRAFIDERLKAETLSSAEVLAELTDIAKSEWRDHIQVRYGKMGHIIDAKIVLADKVKSLELLGKYHKLFTDRTELAGANGGPIQVQAVDLSRLNAEELETLERLTLKASVDIDHPGGGSEA